MDRDRVRRDTEEILSQDRYTVEELAALLGMDEHVIRRAAREQELKASFLGDSILYIRREDVLRWLEARG